MMQNPKSKTTILIIIALILVCGGSFAGVKLLNNSASASTVLTNAPAQTTTTTTAALTTTTAPSTTAAPETTEKPSESTTATTAEKTTTAPDKKEEASNADVPALTQGQDVTQSPFTTFATPDNTSSSDTTKAPSVTTPVPEKQTTIPQEAQQVINKAAESSSGFLGYLFDPEGDYYYTSNDPWQRNFGFNEYYDIGAAFINFYYDTMRCKFNYNHKDWMIQFWKGQYGFVFIGAEIGVYNKPESRTVEHYDCATDEECLYMSMTFYRKGVEKITREYAKYWWCTGFVPGKLDKYSDRSELTLKARITAVDYKMLIGICGGLKEAGLKYGDDFATSGLDVFVTY